MKSNGIWKILGVIFFSMITTSGFAQRGYYATDSTMTFGANVVDGTEYENARYCKVIDKEDSTTLYTPDQVKEYGLSNGKVFVAKEVDYQKVFLERLVKGETNLYFFKRGNERTFFVERDSTYFREMPKEQNGGYRSFLNDYTSDCEAVSEAVKLVSYYKKPLAEFFERYNSCELKPFPFLRYGVVAGYEMMRLDNADYFFSYMNDMNYKYNGSFTVGLFIDQPIMVSDYSFHAEINYSRQDVSYTLYSQELIPELTINTSYLRIPFMIRYTHPFLKTRPFINLGGIYSMDINNKSELWEEVYKGGEWIEYERKVNLIDHQQGFIVGGGLQFRLDYRRSFFVEARYGKLYRSFKKGYYNTNLIQILAGINF